MIRVSRTRVDIELHLPRLLETEGFRLVLADESLRGQVTALLNVGYRRAKKEFDRSVLGSYPLDTVVIVGTRKGDDEPVLTVALKMVRHLNALEPRLEVDAKALLGDEAFGKLQVPAAVAARATCSISGMYPSARPAILNLAGVLGSRVQLSFNPESNGIASNLEPLGYSVHKVPKELATKAVFPGPQVVTRLDESHFRSTAGQLAARMFGGAMPLAVWSEEARLKLEELGGNAWF